VEISYLICELSFWSCHIIQDFAFATINLGRMSSSRASDAVLGRVLVAVLQASALELPTHMMHFFLHWQQLLQGNMSNVQGENNVD
jgi:hypothetical protein